MPTHVCVCALSIMNSNNNDDDDKLHCEKNKSSKLCHGCGTQWDATYIGSVVSCRDELLCV